ncbi:thiamine pyrophosphate-binding protein [Natronospora cellulosivora (SeqCode)]
MLVKDLIIQQLENIGVKHIYNYSGDTTLSFLSALKGSSIKVYSSQHESAAGLMASAEAKATGNLAVCLSHSGPGTANIINGIADASMDRVPLLLISGQVATHNLGTNYKQFLNQIELTNPITLFSTIVVNPEGITDALYKAISTSIAQGGVSHLVIPMDIWDQETNDTPREYPLHLDTKMIPDINLINKAAEEINNAKKISIIYGRGCKECPQELKTLAEKLQAPLINTLPATGIIEFDNSFEMGGLGHSGNQYSSELLEESELILKLAATWWPVKYTPKNKKILQFDSIIENIGSTHPVDLGIPGDIKLSLKELTEKLNKKENQDWMNKINEVKNKWSAEFDAGYSKEDWPLAPSQVIKIVSEYSSDNEIISLDSGDNVIFFGRFFANKCQDVLVSGTWRTMGFALPASIAAKINYPDSKSTAIIGDGGLHMVMAEILTAKRYNIAVKIIVMNNGSLAMEKNKAIAAGLELEEVELTNPDYIKIAEACGIKAYRAESLDNLRNIMNETADNNEVILIDLPIADPFIPGSKLS